MLFLAPMLFLDPMLFLAIAGSVRDFFRVVGGAELGSFLCKVIKA